jgi:glycosyltransferase involved in cell wall biosynthesis
MKENIYKKKVLILSSSHNIGGFETRLKLLLRNLNKEKFELIYLLIYPAYKAKRTPRPLRIRQKKNLMIKEVGVSTVEINMNHRFDLSVILKLAVFLRKHKVQILFFFALGAGTFVAPISGRLAGVPRIIRASGTIVRGLYPSILQFVDRFLILLTDLIITPSEYLKQLMVKDLNVIPKKIIVIPNGIDTERFSQRFNVSLPLRDFGIDNKAFVVGMIANLVPVKAHKVLIHAIPRVLRRFPNTYFLLIGDGPLKKELQGLTKKLCVENHVKFLGFCSDTEKIIPLFHVGVLCSQVETFGNVLLEMASAGKPLVASRVGGIPEIIHHGVTGLLVKQGDEKALADAIVRLLSDSSYAIQLGENGRKYVCQHFSKENMVHQIEQLFLSLD